MKDKKLKLTLNEGRMLFIYEGEDKKLEDVSNIPHLNVEDHTNWKSHPEGNNPNIIGQIHSIGRGKEERVVLHLQDHATGKFLDKEMLKAIIKGIEHIEEQAKKNRKRR